MKRPFWAVLATRVSLLIILVALLLGVYTFFRTRRDVQEFREKALSSTAVQVEARVDSILETGNSQSAIIAGLASPSSLVTGSGADDPARLATPLYEILKAHENFASVSAVFEDGTQVRAGRSSQSPRIVVDVLDAGQVGPAAVRALEVFGGELRDAPVAVKPGDLRESDAYKQALESGVTIWSEAYQLIGIDGVKRLAATCATPIKGERSQIIGVAMVDFSINRLGNFLNKLEPSESGLALLGEARSGQEPRLLVTPQSTNLVTEQAAERVFRTDELRDAKESALAGQLRQSRLELAESGEKIGEVQIGPDLWLFAFRKLQIDDGPSWVSVVAAPASDFTSDLQQTGLVLLLVTIGAIAITVLGSAILARQVTRPLRALAEDTQRIRSLDLKPTYYGTLKIAELDDLAGSVEGMKAGLRSLERLVPSAYAKRLIESGEEARLGGRRALLTVSFADIIGFTALSEAVTPEQLTGILGEYLEVLSEEIEDTEGTIDKYNGDDVMSFWGAPDELPDHPVRACATALSSRDRIRQMHPEWELKGIPALRVSFGVSTGEVIVGNVGSRRRMNYTVIGDSVNLASRLQGLNRAYGTEILVSEATAETAKGIFAFRLIDWVAVHGRENAAAVFELIGRQEDISEEDRAAITAQREALGAYRRQDWDKAEELLGEVLEAWPDDQAALLILRRIKRFRESPPDANWNGVTQMTWK